jgi:ribosomal protein S25
MSNVIGSHQHGYEDGSANRGAVFLVELMIADSVNDQNGNVFWMSNGNLAKKCRLARETVNRIVRELEASGVLKRLGHHDSGAVRYQWIGHPQSVTTDHTRDEGSHIDMTTDHKGCKDTSHEPKETQDQPKPDHDVNLDQIRKIKAGTR